MATKPRQPAKSRLPSTTKPSSADLTNADPDAADSVSEHAQIPSIPGGDMLGRGIFIRPRQAYELKMVLFDRGQTPPSVYHCGANDMRYLVPRGCEVNNSPPMPPEQSLGETLIEESWDRFGKQVTFNASAAVKTSFMTIDPNAMDASSFKTQEDAYYALRNAFVPFFTVYMPDGPNVKALPQQEIPPYLKALQEQIPQGRFAPKNREKYAAIFERYGTHYVKSIWVGGKASLVFTVSKSSELTEQEIRASIQASFGGVATGTTSSEQKDSVEKFKSNSSCRVFGSGGDKVKLAQLSNLDKDAYDEWLLSVKEVPEVIQLGIAGIWTLLQNETASQALKDAYLEETTFVPLAAIIPYDPLAAIIPYDPWLVFLDRDDYTFIYNPRPGHDESKVKDGEEERVKLVERLEVLKDYPRFQRPHAAFSLSEFGRGMDDKIYLFKGNWCLRITVGAKPSVAADFPKPIERVWPGVSFDQIDAAIAVPPNRAYFFRGVEYIRVDLDPEGIPYFVARDFLTERWKGVTFERIDTAAYFGNSKVYFFSGDQYIRYDLAVCRADPGYPKFILSNYVEDWELFE